MSCSSRLSQSRREKLVNLKKREDLKDALTEKFKGRFGHTSNSRAPDEMSVASATIREEVNCFAKTADVTASNLGRLERRIQSRARPTGDAASEVSGYSLSPSQAGGSQVGRSRSVGSLAGANIVSSGPKTYDWSKLDEYASYLHEQDCMRQQMGVKALQRKLRSDLDAQIQLKQGKRAQEDDEEQRYHENSMVELERWKVMEQARAEEKQAKLHREKSDRDQQLAFERKLKDEEVKRKKNEESNLVEKIVNEMEAEQKKFEKKKEQTKKNMRKVFNENNADQARRDAEKQQDKEREAAALKEYARVLDEQEEQRNAEMQARMKRQTELMAKLQANVDGIKKGAGDNDAARASAQQEEMDRHFHEAEVVKQTRLKQMRLENQAYLLKQMEDKDARKDDDLDLQDIQAQILIRDTEEYNQMEKDKVINRRQKLMVHSNHIKQQMVDKLARSTPAMTEAEILMNKPLLDLVSRTLEDAKSLGPMQTLPEGEDEDN